MFFVYIHSTHVCRVFTQHTCLLRRHTKHMCVVCIHSTHVCCVFTQHTCALCIYTTYMCVVYIHNTHVCCVFTKHTCVLCIKTTHMSDLELLGLVLQLLCLSLGGLLLDGPSSRTHEICLQNRTFRCVWRGNVFNQRSLQHFTPAAICRLRSQSQAKTLTNGHLVMKKDLSKVSPT